MTDQAQMHPPLSQWSRWPLDIKVTAAACCTPTASGQSCC